MDTQDGATGITLLLPPTVTSLWEGTSFPCQLEQTLTLKQKEIIANIKQLSNSYKYYKDSTSETSCGQ